MASDPLDERLTQVRCGVHLHVRTCTPPSNDGAFSPRSSIADQGVILVVLVIAVLVLVRVDTHLNSAVVPNCTIFRQARGQDFAKEGHTGHFQLCERFPT